MDGVGTLQLIAELVVCLAVQVRPLGRSRALVLHPHLRLPGVTVNAGLDSEGQPAMPVEPMGAVAHHLGTEQTLICTYYRSRADSGRLTYRFCGSTPGQLVSLNSFLLPAC